MDGRLGSCWRRRSRDVKVEVRDDLGSFMDSSSWVGFKDGFRSLILECSCIGEAGIVLSKLGVTKVGFCPWWWCGMRYCLQ